MNIEQIVQRMRKEVVVTTIWYHFKKYPSSFVGSDAVRWMIRSQIAHTVEAAVELGQSILKAGFIEHVTREKDFINGHVLYRFTASELTTITSSVQFRAKQPPSPLRAKQIDRAKAAILGAIIADAATGGVNGISEGPAIYALMMKRRQITPEFFDKESDDRPVGETSAIGQEGLALLRSLARVKEMNIEAYAQDVQNYYRSYDGDLRETARECLKRLENGATYPKCAVRSKSAEFIAKIPFITARYAGTRDLLTKVEQCVAMQQNNTDALIWAKACARILEKIILGMSTKDALKWATTPGSLEKKQTNALMKVIRYSNLSAAEAVDKFGKSASLPGAVQSSIQQLLNGTDFAEVVRGNMMAGGESCLRAIFIGACMAAECGIHAVPAEWKAKTVGYSSVKQMANSVMKERAENIETISQNLLMPEQTLDQMRHTLDISDTILKVNEKIRTTIDLSDAISASAPKLNEGTEKQLDVVVETSNGETESSSVVSAA